MVASAASSGRSAHHEIQQRHQLTRKSTLPSSDVDCRYKRFGFSAASAVAARAAASDSKMRRAAAKRKTPPATKQNAAGNAAGDPAVPPARRRAERHHREVREGQPRRTELIVTRSQRVEETPRVIEVRLGIAIPLEVAVAEKVPDGRGAQNGKRAGDQESARTSRSSVAPS